jgi:hypothetical protein
MIEDSNDKNKMMLAATLNTGLDGSGVENTAKNRKFFATLIEELDASPIGVMVSPVFEWPDDTYDELSANSDKAWGAPRTLEQMRKGN